MTANELQSQVTQEQAELAAAPVVPSAGLVGRCHFCGAVVRDTQLVETVNGQARHRGIDCCGGGRFKL